MSKTAFILAAGQGSRMMPLTRNTPKPLLKINNKPLLQYILDLLSVHGFTKISLNTFYLKEQIEKYLKKSDKLEIQIIEEDKLSGTAGAVRKIARATKPTRPFLVISSDMLINFDLSKIYDFHIKHQGLVTICCYFRPKEKLNLKKSGLVLFNKKTKRIIKFMERPESDVGIISQWVNSSVYIFNPEVVGFIPKKQIADIAKDLITSLLKSGKPIYAYPINGKKFYQLGIDAPKRIKLAEEDIKSGKFIP